MLYPVTLVWSLAAFGPASSIAVAGCYIFASSLLLQTVKTPGLWKSPSLSVWTSFSLSGLVFSLPMICFVYAFHYVQTDTLSELQNPSFSRIRSVNVSTVSILLVCYIFVGICGYLLQSGGIHENANISSNILNDLPKSSTSVLLAKWSIGSLLLITYSLFIITLRRKLEMLLFQSLDNSFFSKNRLLVAALINIGVGIVSICLPNLGIANALAGGCIALIMFEFPGCFIIKIQMERDYSERSVIQVAIGISFCFFGSLIAIIGLFGSAIFEFWGPSVDLFQRGL